MLGSWYGPKELAKRTAILLEIESIASMFSGYLQAGLHSSMDGRAGIAGWRWLFVMDAIISLPVAIWGFFGLPDTPHTTRAFYWSEKVNFLQLHLLVSPTANLVSIMVLAYPLWY